MAESARIAVVTGANRGIGFEICRQLARAGLTVMLTSRSAAKGRTAVRTLHGEGLQVDHHVLDVTSPVGIKALAAGLAQRYGRVDVLVNNAGVLIDPQGSRIADSRPQTYHETLETNLLGPLLVIQALLPLIRKSGHGRIVNISSGLGRLATMDAGSPAYRISKAALNALTAMLAAEVRGSGILVNAACPGWVRTSMGGPSAQFSVEEGADTAVWLATLPDGGPSGGLFKERKPVSW
jgi:NAD(P)-dependent dehydrogenase (short-subunit alcohol dehydrogenase family)